MATTIERLDLVYCDGWDFQARAPARPLSPEAAQRRERAGERYAVLLVDRAPPTALVEVTPRCQRYTVWHFDDQLRRAGRSELQRVGRGELVLSERVQWRYQDRRRPEFDPAAPRRTCRYSPDGLVHDIDEPQGDTGASRHRFGSVRDWPVRYRLPEFGDPAPLVHLADAVAQPLAVVGGETRHSEVVMSPLVAVPWRPPTPARPSWLAPMFRHGARCQVPDHGEVTVEVCHVGRLGLPTGRLVAADLHGLAAAVPFTVRAAPGRYPVSMSRLRRAGRPAPATVAAVRVEIRPDPVASWELALRPYRDPCALGSWQFFGFEVATGTACLADASSPTDVLAFPAEPGTYPTWIGRTAHGEVACYVADLLRLPDARVGRG